VPELPEVETVRAGLRPRVVGRRIVGVDVLHPRATRRQPAGLDFADALLGHTITDVSRRGKYMWLPLSTGDAILAHLGMSGQFRFPEPGTGTGPEPTHPHLRVRFRLLDPGTGQIDTCWFLDQRTFGGLSISVDGAELPHELAHIARDPLDPLFDLRAAVTKVRSRRVGIKRVLLDQTVVSGVGNIYADEALWRTRLHFARDASLLRRSQVVELVGAVRAVFEEALVAGGTSFDSLYVNVNGESGYFDRTLAAYGQEGRPCPRCGTPIRRMAFMNRSSHYCPRCQRTPRAPRW
jgi:formamidopyrimidine-DNA glycosylase